MGIFMCALTCYHARAACSTVLCFSSNCSARATWICATGIMISVWQSPKTLQGKCLEVVTHDISVTVEWAWWAQCMASWTVWPYSSGFLPIRIRTLEGTCVHSSSCKYQRSHRRLHTAVTTEDASMLQHVWENNHVMQCCLPWNSWYSFETPRVSMRGTMS
jgi:hypothetical protein